MSYGLYIHFPFCRRKCPYCAFSSITNAESLFPFYCDALIREFENCSRTFFEGDPETVYIGGGTPSLIPANLIVTIIRRFGIGNANEFTIEANPDSITLSWIDRLIACGLNRISIGVQSLDDTVLSKLGRLHDAESARKAVRLARKSGIESVSLDLMFGVPGQTIDVWRETIDGAINLGPDHISAYSLGIEDDTAYFQTMQSGGLVLPDEEETADMYAILVDMLAEAGIERYEISNFARTDHQCRHNRGYWQGSAYYGIGASAHSFDGTRRWWNLADPVKYTDACLSDKTSPIDGYETITNDIHRIEGVMLSLRTSDGLPHKLIDTSPEPSRFIIAGMLQRYIKAGLLRISLDGNYVLTNRGVVLADEIIGEIASEL